MILENENTVLGGLVADTKQILSTMAGVAFLTAFIGLLFAPALEPLLCKGLYTRANNGTRSEMLVAQRQLKRMRIGLWIACVVSWIAAIAILAGFNNY